MGIKKRVVVSWSAFLLTLALIAPVSTFAQEQYVLLTPEAVIQLTNIERSGESLVQYRENNMLTAAAEEKAEDMATRGYFAHATPEGEKTWNLVREHGYQFSRVGENLAVKFSDPSRVVSMWMASPGHRANLLNEKFVDIGVGIAEGVYQGATTTYVVALYAAPLVAQNDAAGEVKGEQEPPHESAGLLASFEPEISPRGNAVSNVTQESAVDVAERSSQQHAAAASIARRDSFRDIVTHLLSLLVGFLKQ